MPNGADAEEELERAWDLMKSARRTVFIAFDLEWYQLHGWEQNRAIPLEIGWASSSINCGCDCEHWSGGHMIIDEYSHIRNGRYVPDNKDDYKFGDSQYWDKSDAFYTFQQLVKRAGRGRLPCGCTATYPCDVVLVAHDCRHGLSVLRDNGCEISPRVEVIDVQLVAWGLKHFQGQGAGRMKLSRILDWMEIDDDEERFPHNAGNDAMYTLEALFDLIDTAEEDGYV